MNLSSADLVYAAPTWDSATVRETRRVARSVLRQRILDLGGEPLAEEPQMTDETYEGLRKRALTRRSADLGLSRKPGRPVWGVVMETSTDDGITTLVATDDGCRHPAHEHRRRRAPAQRPLAATPPPPD